MGTVLIIQHYIQRNAKTPRLRSVPFAFSLLLASLMHLWLLSYGLAGLITGFLWVTIPVIGFGMLIGKAGQAFMHWCFPADASWDLQTKKGWKSIGRSALGLAFLFILTPLVVWVSSRDADRTNSASSPAPIYHVIPLVNPGPGAGQGNPDRAVAKARTFSWTEPYTFIEGGKFVKVSDLRNLSEQDRQLARTGGGLSSYMRLSNIGNIADYDVILIRFEDAQEGWIKMVIPYSSKDGKTLYIHNVDVYLERGSQTVPIQTNSLKYKNPLPNPRAGEQFLTINLQALPDNYPESPRSMIFLAKDVTVVKYADPAPVADKGIKLRSPLVVGMVAGIMGILQAPPSFLVFKPNVEILHLLLWGLAGVAMAISIGKKSFFDWKNSPTSSAVLCAA